MNRFKVSLARAQGKSDWMARGDEAPRLVTSLVKEGHGLSPVPTVCLSPPGCKRTASALKELTGRLR